MNREKNNPINRLARNQRRGSKPRCHLLTHGSKEQVAARLTALIAPWGQVRPSDAWKPEGFDNLEEAQLHKAPRLLEDGVSQQLQSWWLSIATEKTMTPNWDIASTCLIEGMQGLLLVEAKAYDNELNTDGRTPGADPFNERAVNHKQICKAVANANSELNKLVPGWNLSQDSHYQLVNRFAWSWKLATLGIPVILVYLGFLNAKDMQDKGRIFENYEDWRKLMLSHGDKIIPASVWETKLHCGKAAFTPLLRTVECPLEL